MKIGNRYNMQEKGCFLFLAIPVCSKMMPLWLYFKTKWGQKKKVVTANIKYIPKENHRFVRNAMHFVLKRHVGVSYVFLSAFMSKHSKSPIEPN